MRKHFLGGHFENGCHSYSDGIFRSCSSRRCSRVSLGHIYTGKLSTITKSQSLLTNLHNNGGHFEKWPPYYFLVRFIEVGHIDTVHRSTLGHVDTLKSVKISKSRILRFATRVLLYEPHT